MTRGQRLAAILVAVAVLLLLGRGGALLYVDRAWYDALGALSVWRAKMTYTLLMYGAAVILGVSFAFVNFSAVQRSVLALVIPKYIGSVDIGKEIPGSRLAIVAMGMSLCVAVAGVFALPSWTMLDLWRSNVSFGEVDPYFSLDLGFYVAWLPLESALYVWAFIVFAITVLVVVTLHILAHTEFELEPYGYKARATTHARRHLMILAAILVLFSAWGFRLDAYNTLITGKAWRRWYVHPYGSSVWSSPRIFILSMVTIAAAVVLLTAGWIGQTASGIRDSQFHHCLCTRCKGDTAVPLSPAAPMIQVTPSQNLPIAQRNRYTPAAPSQLSQCHCHRQNSLLTRRLSLPLPSCMLLADSPIWSIQGLGESDWNLIPTI